MCRVIYGVQLSEELQIFTQKVCEEYKVPYKLVLSLMWRESAYDIFANDSKGRAGLMHLDPRLAEELFCECNVYDIYEPFLNIRGGIHIFSDYYRKYGIVKALMCYQCGESEARQMWQNGINSTEYVEDVLSFSQRLSTKKIYHEI